MPKGVSLVRLCSRNLEMLKRVSGRWKLNGSSCSEKSKQELNSSTEPQPGQPGRQTPIIPRYFSKGADLLNEHLLYTGCLIATVSHSL